MSSGATVRLSKDDNGGMFRRKETEKAVGVNLIASTRCNLFTWIPKSLIVRESDCTIEVPEWFVIKSMKPIFWETISIRRKNRETFENGFKDENGEWFKNEDGSDKKPQYQTCTEPEWY